MNEIIPFLNLKEQYRQLKPEIDMAIHSVMDRGDYIKGVEVREFEEKFAKYLQAKHCIGVANGTDALVIALKAMGIGKGDEVITVPNTFIATVEAIAAVGATPVLCAINEQTYTMDPCGLEKAITSKTKALIPVHLYGMPCDMESILNIANKYDLKILCDAAQAHGTRYRGQSLANFADATTYSFYPGKNLGAYGDAGAIVTNNDDLARKAREIADHGRKDKYLHQVYGTNSRLDTIQAAVLSIKLPYLEKWNERRREIAAQYSQGFGGLQQIICPYVPDYAEPVWHLYVIRVENRLELQSYLREKGIQTGIHYPVAVHDQPAAGDIICRCDTMVTTEMSKKYLSLPICPYMTDEMVERVKSAVISFYKRDK